MLNENWYILFSLLLEILELKWSGGGGAVKCENIGWSRRGR